MPELPSLPNGGSSEAPQNPEAMRQEQLMKLGQELAVRLVGATSFRWNIYQPDKVRQQFEQIANLYLKGEDYNEHPIYPPEGVKNALRIMKVYFEDKEGVLEIPTEVVTVFEDQETGKLSSFRQVKSKIEEIKAKANRSFENAGYRPLIIIGPNHQDAHSFDEDPSDQKTEIDAGNAHVLFYRNRASKMHQINRIKAKTIIVDDTTMDTLPNPPMKDIDLECNTLAVTERGQVGSPNLVVREAIVQTGGKFLSTIRNGIHVDSIQQNGGIINANTVSTRTYTQLGGENNAATTIVQSHYTRGKDAKLVTPALWLAPEATFEDLDPGRERYAGIQIGVPATIERPIDDIYRRFGKSLVEYFFPSDREDWTEMQRLFDAWFEKFEQTHEIPQNFLEAFPDVASGHHLHGIRDWQNTNYKYTFGHIANMVAFFYLNRLAPLPDINRIIDTPDLKEFQRQVKSAKGGDVLILLREFSGEGEIRPILFEKHARFGEATVYKGAMDTIGNFMTRYHTFSSQNILINAHPDTKTKAGNSSMEHTQFVVNINCENLGVMQYGYIDKETKVTVSDTVVQYGTIGEIDRLTAENRTPLRLHIQEAGVNKAIEERCGRYEQRKGSLEVGTLWTGTFQMSDGIVGGTKIFAEDEVIITGGVLEHALIDGDNITIDDGVTIRGALTIYYTDTPPRIGDNVQGKELIKAYKLDKDTL